MGERRKEMDEFGGGGIVRGILLCTSKSIIIFPMNNKTSSPDKIGVAGVETEC